MWPAGGKKGVKLAKYLASVLYLGLVGTCSTGGGVLDIDTIFSSEITEIRYEIDYMPGAEPYVGTSDDNQVWDFLKNNIIALFGGKKTITIPTTLEEMEQIEAGNQNYSQEEILALAAAHRANEVLDGSIATVYIIFVDGFFSKDGVAQKTVLGISIGNTGVIAVFKPAITTNVFPSQRLRNFTEQSVLIHESGHSLGLVNNGLTLATSHHDSDHGAHCTNQKCVMYFQNEGAADLLEFIKSGDASAEKTLYGPECLGDAQAALN